MLPAQKETLYNKLFETLEEYVTNIIPLKKINDEVGKVDKPLCILWNVQEKKEGNVNITSCGEYAIIPKDFFYTLIKKYIE